MLLLLEADLSVINIGLASVDAPVSTIVPSFPSSGSSDASDVLTAFSDSCGKARPELFVIKNNINVRYDMTLTSR